MVSLSQRLSRSGDKRLFARARWTRTVVSLVAFSVVITSRALAQVKKSSALCHTHFLSFWRSTLQRHHFGPRVKPRSLKVARLLSRDPHEGDEDADQWHKARGPMMLSPMLLNSLCILSCSALRTYSGGGGDWFRHGRMGRSEQDVTRWTGTTYRMNSECEVN